MVSRYVFISLSSSGSLTPGHGSSGRNAPNHNVPDHQAHQHRHRLQDRSSRMNELEQTPVSHSSIPRTRADAEQPRRRLPAQHGDGFIHYQHLPTPSPTQASWLSSGPSHAPPPQPHLPTPPPTQASSLRVILYDPRSRPPPANQVANPAIHPPNESSTPLSRRQAAQRARRERERQGSMQFSSLESLPISLTPT